MIIASSGGATASHAYNVGGVTIPVARQSVLVRLKQGATVVDMQRTLQTTNLRVDRQIGFSRWYVIAFPMAVSVEDAIIELSQHHEEFANVQPNFAYTHAAELSSELDWDSLWSIHPVFTDSISGQDYGWHSGMNVSAAWDIFRGDPDVTLAILDTGIPMDSAGALTHRDLSDASRITLGTFYFPGGTCSDDTCLNDTYPTHHGTSMTSIAAADSNGTGMVGVDFRCGILIHRIGPAGGSVTHSDLIAEALMNAVDRGAHVVNLSWELAISSHSNYPCSIVVLDTTLEDAIRYAHDSDVVICSARMNADPSTPGISSPAIYSSYGTHASYALGYPNIIDIGGLRPNHAHWGATSCRDLARIDVVAPAYHIFQAKPPDTFDWGVGTSQATAAVSGLVSLLRGFYGTKSATDIRSLLRSTADKIWKDSLNPAYANRIVVDSEWDSVDFSDSTWHPWYGYGRVNAYRALGGRMGELATETWGDDEDTIWLSEATLPSGSTLTIQSGTVVRMSRYDLKGSGVDSVLSELVIAGTLVVQGSPSSPVIFEPAAESDEPAWYGIRVASGGHLTLENATLENAKVAIRIESGAIVDTIVGCTFVDCGTGIEARHHSPLVLRDVNMTGISDFGVRVDSGFSAVVRLDSNVHVGGIPDSSWGAFIGDNARLVARYSSFDSGYIGLELNRNGVDTIMYCSFRNNTLYGVKFDSGQAADYSRGNHVENVSATSLNQGITVIRQSIVSDSDKVMGGYNWDFNVNSYQAAGRTARITTLQVKAKSGDDWGLVLNGPSATNDSAFVLDTSVDSVFESAHLYLKDLHVEIRESQFVSTGTTTASPVGIKDVGTSANSSGFVECTKVIGQKTYGLERTSTSDIDYGSSLVGSVGRNSIYSAATGSKAVRNNSSATLRVEMDWWGTASPDSVVLFSGAVDFRPYLTAAPTTCPSHDPPDPDEKIPATTASPFQFSLAANFPNPFNPTTVISFTVPTEQLVRMDIYNVIGRRVKSFDLGIVSAGAHLIIWDGNDVEGRAVGSGVYFYRMWSHQFTAVRKMLLLR